MTKRKDHSTILASWPCGKVDLAGMKTCLIRRPKRTNTQGSGNTNGEIQASSLQGQPDPRLTSPRSPLGIRSTRPCGAVLRLQMCSFPCILRHKLASWFKNLRFSLGSGHPPGRGPRRRRRATQGKLGTQGRLGARGHRATHGSA